MTVRKIEGGVCARCRSPIGLVSINGKAIEVEGEAVVWDDVVVLKLHFCRKLAEEQGGDLGPGVERGQVVVNGKKVANGKR